MQMLHNNLSTYSKIIAEPLDRVAISRELHRKDDQFKLLEKESDILLNQIQLSYLSIIKT